MKEGFEKRRILFVDDEPRILDGLRRMLRSLRQKWEMKFAENGPAALKMLGREPFDVLVTDMRMPGMDGLQLLMQVKQRFPEVVRIVFSGHSDQEMILKSVRHAHQYLSKPCDPGVLISTVKRSCALRDLLGQDALRRIVSGIESLPSLPSLYTELMQEMESPDGSIHSAGKIMEKDLGMSAKILQLVNSSFFGVPRHVTNPSHAVMLLGLDIVRGLVLAVGLFSKFDSRRLSGLGMETVYAHSMKVGALARELAKGENLEKQTVDNTFMAGLLHDLGKLVFATNFPEAYREVFALSRGGVAFHEAETEKLGASHAEVGAYLVSLWGLPDTIVEGLAFHHNPAAVSTIGFTPLIAVYAANILEHQTRSAAGGEAPGQGLDAGYLKRIGLGERAPAWIDLSRRME